MFKGITLHPDHLTVTLDIPWELARVIAKDGPALIGQLATALEARKEATDRATKLKPYRDPAAKSRLEEWARLAAHVDEEIRRRCPNEGIRESRVIAEISRRIDVPHSSLRALLENFRADRRKRQREARRITVIRLYMKGYSNAEIGKRTSPPVGKATVGRIIRDNKGLIAKLLAPEDSQAVSFSEPAKPLNSGPATVEPQALAPLLSVAERRACHARIGVQLYRQYRRARPTTMQRWQCLKELGARYHLPASYADYLCAERRRKVQNYLEGRRAATIERLLGRGLSYGRIATHIGVHEKTVARMARLRGMRR